MYVADTYNNRVQMFSMPGPTEPPPTPLSPQPSGQISNPGGVAPIYPAGVEIVDGTWYAADSGGARVVTLNPTTGAAPRSTATGLLKDPRDLEVDADPTALWVTNTGGNSVVRISRTGGSSSAPPSTGLNQPYGLPRRRPASTWPTPTEQTGRCARQPTATAVWRRRRATGRVQPAARRRPARQRPGRVADTDNNRIVILDPATGNCVGNPFGTRGTNPGQFKSPRSVTSDGAGGMWVADALNHRVQHRTAAGAGRRQPGRNAYGEGNGSSVPRTVSPRSRARPTSRCATRSTSGSGLGRRGPGPQWQENIGGTKPRTAASTAPSVAYGPDGSIYAADWFNHRIQKFSPERRFVTSWGGYGPERLADLPARHRRLPDGRRRRHEQREQPDRRLQLQRRLPRSVKPKTGTALSRPHQTALDGTGGYWIADTHSNRVLHLDSDGDVLLTVSIAGPAAGSKPEGVAVDSDGSILVSNTQSNKVERYNATTGALIGTVAANGTGNGQVRKPAGLLVTGTGQSRRLWIADGANNRVIVLNSTGAVEATFGSAGAGVNQFNLPQGVAVDPTDGDIAVADNINNRISLWEPQGAPPVDTANPTVTFTAPASGASLPAGAVAVAGTSSDDTSVSSVGVAVQRSSDNLWFQANGTWASTQTFVPATLAAPGATSSTWTFSVPATTAGTYSMTARVTDQAAKTGQATRSFVVAASSRLGSPGHHDHGTRQQRHGDHDDHDLHRYGDRQRRRRLGDDPDQGPRHRPLAPDQRHLGLGYGRRPAPGDGDSGRRHLADLDARGHRPSGGQLPGHRQGT